MSAITVGQLVELLSMYDPEMRVAVDVEPDGPFELAIARVEESETDAGQLVLYVADRAQAGAVR